MYIKHGSDRDFYDNGIFPYSYKNTSKDKEDKIRFLTNWDGDKIQEYIKSAAKKVCLRFVEAESENSVKDYGNKSLFSKGKLKLFEWAKMPHNDDGFLKHNNPIVNFELGSRKDGKLKVNLVFPPDYDYCPFRHYVYDSCVNDIKSYLQENNINYFQSWEDANRKNHFRKSLTITPKIDGNGLTKVFDTKEAVSKAIKNNDLVIVAGDGSNDFEMLNPLEYISKQEWEQYAFCWQCCL